MTKVKLGDRVRMIKDFDAAHVDEVGTVIATFKPRIDGANILILFDEKSFKHNGSALDCNASVKRIEPYPSPQERSGRCQFVASKCVEVLQTPSVKDKKSKFIICVDDNKVIAKLIDDKRTVATGIAKCSPSDTFNFLVGAQLAMQRCIAKQNTEPLVIDIEAAKALGIKFNP